MKNVRDLLKLHEGSVTDSRGNHIPYKCSADKTTLGWGRNIQERGISDSEADMLLTNDILIAAAEVERHIDNYADLGDVRQAVLIDMCFNLGWTRMSGFKKTLAAVEAGDFDTAAIEMLDSKWARQVGRRARTLSAMMATAVWPPNL